MPRIEPEPSSSRNTPHERQHDGVAGAVGHAVQRESRGGFCRANASARPMTMQLVMMSPTYGPSCLEMSQ